MRVCFVSTRRGSRFMTELLCAIATACTEAGHSVELVYDRFPPLEEETVYVGVPHELHAHGDPNGLPDTHQRARTIALCTENPGTPWFQETLHLATNLAAAVSINRSSAAELERHGIPCAHIQLGCAPRWDTWQRDEHVPSSSVVRSSYAPLNSRLEGRYLWPDRRCACFEASSASVVLAAAGNWCPPALGATIDPWRLLRRGSI
jgi:hypothetical protein